MKKKRNLVMIYILTYLLGGVVTATEARISFNRDVRPILSDNCYFCHGPDASQRQADLRLDLREAAIATQIIVPFDAQASEFIARLVAEDEDQRMPPPDSNKRLSQQQLEILRSWIDQGAEYEPHWSFVPLGPVEHPEVIHTQWPRNSLDRFVLARLESEGLRPSPEGSKEALLRRVSLDLTGLPPTMGDLKAFLADGSPDAYERVVERLLNSPHYGERMAIDWLDAARYADSNGYQVDRDRELWHWRDWVISAFNDNMPFDQFTIEQLAGDLLPEATIDQRIATGFHRNHMYNEEGGILPDEFLAEYTADRVETTAAVWLGQTFNCNRCHDHKFDPFTQRDFYAMKAFFHNVPERGGGIYGNSIRTNAPPFLKLPAPELEAKIQRLNQKLTTAKQGLSDLTEKASKTLQSWSQQVVETPVRWTMLNLQVLQSSARGEPHNQLAASVEVFLPEIMANGSELVTLLAVLPPQPVGALRLVCTPTASDTQLHWSQIKLAGEQPFSLRPASFGDSLADTETAKLLDGNAKTQIQFNSNSSTALEAILELEPRVDGLKSREIEIQVQLEKASGPTHWQLFATDVESELLVPSELLSLVQLHARQNSADEKRQLLEFRVSKLPEYRHLTEQVDALTKQITDVESEVPTTLVMEEMQEARKTFVLLRGAYDQHGEEVTPATPAVLPALDRELPRNRLGLANWLVHPKNPLTSRVTVNRLWQQVFGNGLVKTSEDFGSQGALPSHPELLDWLAQEFISSGWNVKHVMKLMVLSATYRQQAHLNPHLTELDPENRLLARAPRFRLMGELVRDQALASSGLLVATLGGPSVKPYHPPGLYEQITAGRGYNVYIPGQGSELYRRSMYTYWKRSVPHPAMLIFDAPFRESCTLSRPRSNTPLQALNLMNDPTYVEAARFLAKRILLESAPGSEAQLKYGFRLLLTRLPRPDELTVLSNAYTRAFEDFIEDPAAATLLLKVGDTPTEDCCNPIELAALTTVVSTLLNLDETIMK